MSDCDEEQITRDTDDWQSAQNKEKLTMNSIEESMAEIDTFDELHTNHLNWNWR